MRRTDDCLIHNADLTVSGHAAGQDVLIHSGMVVEIGRNLQKPADVPVINADGGALIPSLKDHHIHLAATAVARSSVACGPPQVGNEDELIEALTQKASSCVASEWVRGIGYHDSVAGEIDRHWLDRHVPDVPVRIQHRGGRLWILNSRALDILAIDNNAPVESIEGVPTGRVYDQDVWLRQRMNAGCVPSGYPNLGVLSRELAAFGITAVTDTTPSNDQAVLSHLAASIGSGELLQSVRLMGNASLNDWPDTQPSGITQGEFKIHLLESALPELSALVQQIRAAHDAGRCVAIHCVSRTELVFALTALEEAGTLRGDRIEHASVTSPDEMERIVAAGLSVVTQPVLVYERGDQYLKDVDVADQPWLYRLQGFIQAGVNLAGSSDGPYGDINPWLAMAAAVNRKTRDGQRLPSAEALSPEQALALYTGELHMPGKGNGVIEIGQAANLCLLTQPWSEVRADLQSARVRQTFHLGRRLLSDINQPDDTACG